MFNVNGKITPSQLLFPVSLLAFVVFIMLAFGTTQVMRDHSGLKSTMAQQDKPMEEAQRVQAQLSALANGTLKLSQKGDKNAEAIIARMKQLGILVGGQQQGQAAPEGAAPAEGAAPVEPAKEPEKEPAKR